MGMQRLASAVPQLQHVRGGAYLQTKAFQTSRLLPNFHLFPNKTTTYGSVYPVDTRLQKVWMVTQAGARHKNRSLAKRHAETDTV